MKKSFEEVFEDKTKYGTKIKASEYHNNGRYLIIDQGQADIAGYTNLEDGLFKDVPVIIFGDHTRVIKYVEEPFFLGADGTKILRSKIPDANYKYLYYALKNAKIPNTGYNRHFKWLKDVKIQYYDTSTQTKIVNILDKINGVIEARQQEIRKLNDLIKARFIEMFGDPVSNPKGWKRVTIDECVDSIENGKSFVCDSMARIGEEPAILKLSAATYGVYKPEENKAIINESDFIEGAEVHSGDLLFTRKNTPELVGMAAYVFMTPKKLMMPDLIFRINTKQNCRKIYLWKLINHELFRSQIQNLASGSAKSMSNISKERLGKLHICLPPLDLQIEFEKFVIQINKSKAAIQKALDKTQLLFDSLMQKYFG